MKVILTALCLNCLLIFFIKKIKEKIKGRRKKILSKSSHFVWFVLLTIKKIII